MSSSRFTSRGLCDECGFRPPVHIVAVVDGEDESLRRVEHLCEECLAADPPDDTRPMKDFGGDIERLLSGDGATGGER